MASCRRCRKRKKRCDQRRPSCTPCINSNNECIYDNRARTQIICYTPAVEHHAVSTETGAVEENIASSNNENDVSDSNIAYEVPSKLQRRIATDHKKIFHALATSAIGGVGDSDSHKHLLTTSGRITMLDHWSRVYFPVGGVWSPGYEFMAFQLMSSVAGTAAADFGCLVQLGQSDATGRLQKAAVTLYPQVMQSLRKTLRKLEPATLIAVVHCVQINEQFNLIAGDHRSSWHRHTSGIRAAIESHFEDGSLKKSLEPGAQHALICNFREFSLWHGLKFGESTSKYAQLWDTDTLIAESGGANVPFDNLAAQVPALIEMARENCRRERKITIDELTNLMSQISRLESSLNGWKSSEIRASLVALNRRDSDISGGENTAVWDAYSSIDAAVIDMCYWGCLLALQKARLDLYTEIPRAEELFKLASTSEQRIISSGSAAAENLLTCIQFLAQVKNGYMGLISSIAPLHLALDWYTRIGDKEGIAICSALQTKAKWRGMCISLSESHQQ